MQSTAESKAKRRDVDPSPASTTAQSQTDASTSSPALPATTPSSTNHTSTHENPHPVPSTSKPTPTSSAKDYLTAQRAKYISSSKNDTYDALLSFQSRLRSSSSTHPTHPTSQSPSLSEQDEEEAKEYGASDDDTDWRSHRLDAGGAPLLTSHQCIDDYEVLDPRDHSSRKEGERLGKRGRDYVDDTRRYKDDRRPRSDRHSSSSRSHRDRNHR
ncbi:hypothetical protein [Sporisorium scitamineum]|nr:hypothetical protein [Sporisorium scitamineum]